MGETYNIRKLGGDKIALLGLFAVSLLTARFVVGLKSTLVLSAPIPLPLPRAGLSVSVPTGNGWQIQGSWTRKGGTLILASSFSAGPAEGTAQVLCRYQAAGTTIPRVRFEQKAREYNGGIVRIDQKVTDSLIFDWARIEGQEMPLTMFLATAILPDDRRLDIEVYEFTGDAEQAEQVFNQVIESVNFEDSRLRTAAPGHYLKEKG